MIVRWRQDQQAQRGMHVASSLRARMPVDKLAKNIEHEYGWTSTCDIATRALMKFSTPVKRGTAASFLTVDQVCIFAIITVYYD